MGSGRSVWEVPKGKGRALQGAKSWWFPEKRAL